MCTKLTPLSFNRRVDWANKPGFWDPYTVILACVPRMKAGVYPKIHWGPCSYEGTNATFDPVACEGIQIYQHPIVIPPEIKKGVEDYIAYPCKETLKLYSARNCENAFYFLLEYLRKRGPFIDWHINNNEDCIACLNSLKHVPTFTRTLFHNLPELDYNAACILGHYLSYVQHVSAGHGMHYIQEILSKLWGPLFLRIVPDDEAKNRFNDEMLMEYPIQIFRRMLHTTPWNQYRPFDGIWNILNPSPEFDHYHKYQELHELNEKCFNVPKEYIDNAGENYLQQYYSSGGYLKGLEQYSREEKKNMAANVFKVDGDKTFPPDTCNINYGGPADITHYQNNYN